MTEYYETGTASNTNDLLNRLTNILSNHGYEINRNTSEGTGRRVHLRKGSLHVNLRSGLNNEIPVSNSSDRYTTFYWSRSSGGVARNIDWLAINTGTGYDSGRQWYNQPGVQIVDDATNKGVSRFLEGSGTIPRYWVFVHTEPTDSVWVYVEWDSRRCNWLGFGNVVKNSHYEGGQFYGANRVINDHCGFPSSLNGSRVQVLSGDYGSENNGWGRSVVSNLSRRYTSNTTQTMVPAYEYYGNLSSHTGERGILYKSYVREQARSILFPVYCFVERVTEDCSCVGSLPNIFYTSMEPYEVGDTIEVAGETYHVFPIYDHPTPWNGKEQTNGSNSTSFLTYECYHYGIGVAIRRPKA